MVRSGSDPKSDLPPDSPVSGVSDRWSPVGSPETPSPRPGRPRPGRPRPGRPRPGRPRPGRGPGGPGARGIGVQETDRWSDPDRTRNRTCPLSPNPQFLIPGSLSPLATCHCAVSYGLPGTAAEIHYMAASRGGNLLTKKRANHRFSEPKSVTGFP